MNKKLLVVVGIILFIGLTFLSFYAHEFYHKFEMRNVEKINETICVSFFKNCKNNGFGHYDFTPIDQENYDKAVEIMEKGIGWEIRAYLFQISFIPLVIFNGLWIFLIYSFVKKKRNAPRILK